MRYLIPILYISTCQLFADSAGDSQELESITVTATRFNELVNDVPHDVHLIDELDILEDMPRSLPETFRSDPGVLVQKTANGKGSPFIRGFTGFRNLLLIDGIRLNNAAFREGPNQYWATVDPLSASRVELIKGQGSVLYGSDAIGGTVNVITKNADPLTYREDELFSEGRILYRGSSAEQSHTGRAEGIVGIGQSTGVILGYTDRRIGNIKASGLGELPRTGFDEVGFDLRMDHYFRENVRGTFAYQQFEQNDLWRVHKTIYGRSWEGTSVGRELRRSGDQSRRLAYAQIKADDLDGPIQKIHTSLSWHNHEESRYRVKSSGKADQQGFDLDSLGAWVQLESDTGIGKLIYGTSYYRDQADTFRNDLDQEGNVIRERIQGPFGDDSTYEQFGVFIQDQINVTDHFNIHFGSRFTHVIADIGNFEDPVSKNASSMKNDWDDVSSSFRGIYKVGSNGKFKVFGGASQGFRAPNFSDLSRLDSARSNEIETPSPDLDPEKFLSYELGSRFDDNKLSAGISIFYTDIRDMIVRTPTGRVIEDELEVIKKNGSEGHVYGIELDASYDISERFRAFGSFAFNDGMADTFPDSSVSSRSEPISRLLPPSGILGLRYKLSDSQWLELSSFIAAKQDNLNTRDKGDTQRIPPGGTPGYTVFNLRYGFQLSEQLLLTLSLENITDEEYRIHGSGQNEPGINFVFGASMTF
ncbi:MAG: TonB-dependent receptor [Verrucomicrobiales bacterium]|jgi:hemoglobin/transferrin/lactoferrin receptor protein|nr:TonB-dependent receptor [Verrucomicrobiales bacterium]